jgi:hypothetical protein
VSVATIPGVSLKVVGKPKAQHFIPVGHLARFGTPAGSRGPRGSVVHVFDKRSGVYRTAKAGTVALENDLYTFRLPDLTGIKPEFAAMYARTFDPANKDVEIEVAKADIEARGSRAMAEIETWPTGLRDVSEDDRVSLLTYMGLLLAQHPTMMKARAAEVRERFRMLVGPRFEQSEHLRAIDAEMARGTSVLALIFDGLATALELNYLAWKVVRWTNGPRLVLGDVGVVAWYPGVKTIGVGEIWAAGAKFLLPISPRSIVIISQFAPGACEIEDYGDGVPEGAVDAFNALSWARSRSQVFALDREDLERAIVGLGPLDAGADYSAQLPVRHSVLPSFEFDERGDLRIVQPMEPSDDEVQERWQARFAAPWTASPTHNARPAK